MGKVVRQILWESEKVLEFLRSVDFIVWLLEPSLCKILVAIEIFLNLNGFIYIVDVLVDTELLYFLIHSGC
jgi:hypothetical protein